MTKAEFIDRLAAVNKYDHIGDHEAFHCEEDKIAIDVFKAIADGTIWNARKAASMMYNQMTSAATRW